MSHCNHCCDGSNACIHNVPIFNHLSIEEKQMILNTAITKTYLKGEMIFSTFDTSANLWVVNQGKVKLVKISLEGKEQMIRMLEPGEFIGELSLFSEENMTSNAYAVTNTEICIINGHSLKQLIRHNPDIAIKFLEVYSKRMLEMEDMIEQFGSHDIEQRIVKTILDELDDTKVSLTKEYHITLPFSKTDWASLIGTTRETLSRKLAKFQKEGWIKLSGQRQIMIHDLESLEDILYK
jgi:CRP/FNR family transcriptional regulator, anaerobic regulatory protein